MRSTTPLSQRMVALDSSQSQDRSKRPPRPSDFSRNALSAAERESGLHMQRIGDFGDSQDASMSGGQQDMQGSPDVSPPDSPVFATISSNGQSSTAAAAAANAANIVGYYSETSEDAEDGPSPGGGGGIGGGGNGGTGGRRRNGASSPDDEDDASGGEAA